MEAHTDEHGLNHVYMQDNDSLWIITPSGERIHVYQAFRGVGMTLWAKEGVKYTKKTHHKTIINLRPKSDY